MKATTDPKGILKQLATIDQMERGKLSVMRQGPNGPFYNLQRWQDGRNVTEYVPAAQVPLVQENIAFHQRFTALVEQYENIITERSRQERRDGVKKKLPTPTSRSPRKPKSKP
jgi:hypothetical protein